MFLQELGKDDRYQFILVQLPEPCDPKRAAYKDGYETLCDIGEGHIRRAGDKIKTELEESNRQLKLGEGPKQLPDIGFRVFELDESGIEKPEPGQLLFDVVKPDLVLCGARGLSSIKYALLGSISTFLLRNTDCDILVVK